MPGDRPSIFLFPIAAPDVCRFPTAFRQPDLAQPEETADAAETSDLSGIDGAVRFEHVRFGYLPDKTVIHDFSLDVAPGKMVAIVGPTGAGKTTIVKLLMRFYDVNSGEIRIDGHPITQISRGALRQNIGMVLQDTWLFHGTIMENIRYGRLDATDEEVIAAAKAARAPSQISGMPRHSYQYTQGAIHLPHCAASTTGSIFT